MGASGSSSIAAPITGRTRSGGRWRAPPRRIRRWWWPTPTPPRSAPTAGSAASPARCAASAPRRTARNGSRRAMTAMRRIFGLTHQPAALPVRRWRGSARRGPAQRPCRPRLRPSASISIPAVQASLAQDGGTALLRLAERRRLAAARARRGDEPRREHLSRRRRAAEDRSRLLLDGHVGTGGATVKWALRREGRKGGED